MHVGWRSLRVALSLARFIIFGIFASIDRGGKLMFEVGRTNVGLH